MTPTALGLVPTTRRVPTRAKDGIVTIMVAKAAGVWIELDERPADGPYVLLKAETHAVGAKLARRAVQSAKDQHFATLDKDPAGSARHLESAISHAHGLALHLHHGERHGAAKGALRDAAALISRHKNVFPGEKDSRMALRKEHRQLKTAMRGSPAGDEKHVHSAMRDIEAADAPGALMSVTKVRRNVPQLDKKRFDGAMLRLRDKGRVALHHHDFADSLKPHERKELVQDGRGMHYVGAHLSKK